MSISSQVFSVSRSMCVSALVITIHVRRRSFRNILAEDKRKAKNNKQNTFKNSVEAVSDFIAKLLIV